MSQPRIRQHLRYFRGDEEVIFFNEDTNEIFVWPDCKISGCKNGVCLRLNSDFCYPHLPYLRGILELERQLEEVS